MKTRLITTLIVIFIFVLIVTFTVLTLVSNIKKCDYISDEKKYVNKDIFDSGANL